MLTLKKIALIGAAGLAAFSMSCSDSEGDSVSITKPEVTADTNGAWALSGGAVITASEGIDSVVINLVDADGATIAMAGGLLPMSVPMGGELTEIDFALAGSEYKYDANALSSCPANTTVTAFLQLTAFSGSETATEKSNEITFTCPTGIEPPPPPIDWDGAFTDSSQVTLGGTGSEGSAADLDLTPIGVYTRNQVVAVINNIDIVYDGTNLWSAMSASLASSPVNGGTLVGTTSGAQLISLTENEFAQIDSSRVPSAIAGGLFDDKFGEDAAGIAVEVGKKFLVSTSNDVLAIIEVKEKNGTENGLFLVVRATSENN